MMENHAQLDSRICQVDRMERTTELEVKMRAGLLALIGCLGIVVDAIPPETFVFWGLVHRKYGHEFHQQKTPKILRFFPG